MIQEEYDLAVEGLKSVPKRYYNIDGRMANSFEQLAFNAKASGFTPKPKTEELQTSVQSPAAVVPVVPTPPVTVPTGGGQTPTSPSAEEKSSTPPKTDFDPTVEIPENLGTLNFNALKALAKALGASPVPNNQAEVLAVIEAARAARQS